LQHWWNEDNLQAKIIGTGACVPDTVITNKDLEKPVDTSDEWIVSRTCIRERRRNH
jgi:3-oxoacyl-[acyl-carrier-protein] synthase-3